MLTLTTEQIVAFAPDDASVKAARGLARPGKWAALGQNNRALWGECKGSALYQVCVDLAEPAFKCTCPSRKFPCKHALGLLLMASGQPETVQPGEPPDWLNEWLAKREQSAKRKAARASPDTDLDPEQQAKRAAAKDKRTTERQRKVDAGLEELERWLRDLARQGLAHVQQQPARYWDGMAARLVDAQAPGLARWLRNMASIPSSGEGWSERLLAELGSLYLLLEGYRRLESLPEPLQADIRSRIGWNWQESDLPADAWVRDCWLMIGQRSYEEEQLRVRHAWLWGRECGRLALALDFAYQNQPMPPIAAPGTWIEAELGFFPSHCPQRALLRNPVLIEAQGKPPALADGATLLEAYSAALAQQPWLSILPAVLADVMPVRGDADHWWLRDQAANRLPVNPGFSEGWRLLALGGGMPLTVFGEWNGEQLWPLGAWTEKRFAAF
ncbi:MAG: SWIM zinc finger family protein [Candidatus Competibacteraceae bacterium]|nr:SWIM zinc finger family protein [Candidatus Competibacteraceae bacterium]MCB1820344.1 SWIM zinc finger family protein [Candidatus Competibacteraceae bacterium]